MIPMDSSFNASMLAYKSQPELLTVTLWTSMISKPSISKPNFAMTIDLYLYIYAYSYLYSLLHLYLHPHNLHMYYICKVMG